MLKRKIRYGIFEAEPASHGGYYQTATVYGKTITELEAGEKSVLEQVAGTLGEEEYIDDVATIDTEVEDDWPKW